MLGVRHKPNLPVQIDRGNFAFFNYMVKDDDQDNKEYMMRYARGDTLRQNYAEGFIFSTACYEFLGMTLEELDEKKPDFSVILRQATPVVGERRLTTDYQDKTFDLYKNIIAVDHSVSMIQFATETTDYSVVGFHKARLLEGVMAPIAGNFCLLPSQASILDFPCLSCIKHKRMSYLLLLIPSALKMISWLNQALKEQETLKDEEPSFKQANLKVKIEVIDSALIAEFSLLNRFIIDCYKTTKTKEFVLATVAKYQLREHIGRTLRLYKSYYHSEEAYHKIRTTFDLTDPTLDEDIQPLYQKKYEELVNGKYNCMQESLDRHKNFKNERERMKLHHKWTTLEDSYFPRVKQYHLKWVESHKLWIFWMQYLDNNLMKLKENNTGLMAMIADRFEDKFDGQLLTNIRGFEVKAICDTYESFEKVMGKL